jgi:DNA polymerase-1
MAQVKIIQTETLTPEILSRMGETQGLWIYNGLDCCVTHEVDTEIESVMDPIARGTYAMSLALQGPVLEMNMRGVLIDIEERDKFIGLLEKDLAKVDNGFDRLCLAIFQQRVNAGSWQQTNRLFYEWLNLPPEKKRNAAGEWAPTTDRDALEKLAGKYQPAKPFVSHILKSRDIAKQISTLRTSLGADGRMHTNYSIAGTKTGRLASSMADFGDGGNQQNIDKRLKKIYKSDPGYKFANIDLEQSDARNIGAMVWNRFPELMQKNRGMNFLDACESGDLHTTVAMMVWPDFPWQWDRTHSHYIRHNREIADQPFYREKSYRDATKVLGHGSNFNGKPPQMSIHTKIDQYLIAQFQTTYFAAFPELIKRIEWVENEINQHGAITTLYGRRRFFLKRRGDNKTLNEGCAYEPQSMTADAINLAMLALFWLRRKWPNIHLLLQVHDSILLQYSEEYPEEEVIADIKKAFANYLTLRAGRKFLVPCEVQVGWNWGYPEYDKVTKAIVGNPNGMIKYKGADNRQRV